MGLNENTNEKAYVLGRIFAVLEAIQEEANPGINTTIKDRYYNSASTTPVSVFPILIIANLGSTRSTIPVMISSFLSA